jgi:hypothetical protein
MALPRKRDLSVITSDDLATIVIKHVIFHDVPQKIRDGAAKPQLSDVETEVDVSQKTHLKTKLTRVPELDQGVSCAVSAKHRFASSETSSSAHQLTLQLRHLRRSIARIGKLPF